MDKKRIIQKLIDKTQAELKKAEESSNSTRELNQAPDMKQEGKYDTRAIEAGYLAGAQMRRVEELKLDIQMLEEIEVQDFSKDDEIAVSALVELKHKNRIQTYFLSTTAGGSFLELGGKAIMVISVFSPIGDAMLGLKVGDDFELQTAKETKEYEIISLN